MTRRLAHPLNAVLGSVVLAASACGTLPGAAVPEPRALTLAEVVDSIASVEPLHRTHWGIEVHEPASGRTLYRLNPEKHFVPASNTKLVVAAVALAELGPDYRYTTEAYVLRRPADTLARGMVVLASGDPTLSARFHGTGLAALEMLADSIARSGVRRVAGELVIDASRFDRALVHPTWEVGDLPWSYAAPVAAFGAAEGTFRVVVAPGLAPGEPASVRVLGPPGVLTVVNTLRTDTVGARRNLDVLQAPGVDAPVLAGTIPFGAPVDTMTLAVTDPAAYAGRALAALLEARGIEVEGGVRVSYDAEERRRLLNPLDPRVERVATWISPPLSDIVAAILKPSQNWIAEQLLKTLGAEETGVGSWQSGLEVERRYLFEVAGIDSGAVFLRDASGLSAQNLLTPHAIVQLLTHARGQPWGETYVAAMAEPGVGGTTLSRRLAGLEGRVYAKTGTITHVNALSGYLRADDGRELVFSILTNGSGRPASEVRRAMDRIVTAIAAER